MKTVVDFFLLCLLVDIAQGVRYYSILMDGNTDASKKEKELIFILYVDPGTGKQKSGFFHFKKWSMQLLQRCVSYNHECLSKPQHRFTKGTH